MSRSPSLESASSSALPECESISPRSTSTRRTAAVLLRQIIAPMATDVVKGSPHIRHASAPRINVVTTCAAPQSRVDLPKPMTRFHENSRPRLNRSRATPSSAIDSICCSALTIARLPGPPMTMPARRYPTSGLCFNADIRLPASKHASKSRMICNSMFHESMFLPFQLFPYGRSQCHSSRAADILVRLFTVFLAFVCC